MFAIPTRTEFILAVEGGPGNGWICDEELLEEVLKDLGLKFTEDVFEDIDPIYDSYVAILHTRNGTIK